MRSRQRAARMPAAGGPDAGCAPARPTLVRLLFAALCLACLAAAVAGGLLRAGASPEAWLGFAALGHAAVLHAAVMMSGFLGTVIAIERAVAVKLRSAFVAPLLSATGAVAMLAGEAAVGAWLGAGAALVFVGVSVVIVLRQTAAHTLLMLVGALAWLVGNLMLAAGLASAFAIPWWFAFIVLTIAAERLEMTRLTRRHPLVEWGLLVILGALLGGAAISPADEQLGGLLYGGALVALAAWLARFDIARHTVRAQGLSRYMAVCLLSGYAWLAVAGLAWVGTAFGCPGRDMALHALGLGFILSMIMGHAPVILPAVARVKLLYGAWFYAPLALLHVSLGLRLFAGSTDAAWRATGSALNALALVAFLLTVAGSALGWRLRHPPRADAAPRPRPSRP